MEEIITELRAMSVPELLDKYESIYGGPTRVRSHDWLWRRIAWKVQEDRYGGLATAAKKQLDDLIAELDLPLSVGAKMATTISSGPVLGTRLRRIWKGREIETTRVEGGWEHDGTVYGSLSAVAKAVTGSHWNGRLFFGLAKR